MNHREVGIQYILHQYEFRMSSLQYLKVVVCFLILTELMRFSVEVLCCEVFKFLGKDLMDFGIKSGKSLSLGMPKAPQGKIQGQPKA